MINGMAAVKLLCLTLFCAVIPAAIAQRSLLQATAPLALHALCGDKSVLARSSTAPVFGTGQPGDTVAVVLSLANAVVAKGSAVVAANGLWVAPLGKLSPGSGYTLTASVAAKSQTVTSTDVAVGELWLISGQSNVGITLDQLTRTNEISFPPFTTAAKQAIATTTNQPNLHLFKVPEAAGPTPSTSLPASLVWSVNDQAVATNYSAIGYLAFSNLATQLGMPVGVVQSNVGGTSIVQWMSAEVLATVNRPATARDAPSINDYNVMIAPLKGVAWSGVVWYQGESDGGLNDANPLYDYYNVLLPALISSWRKLFSQPSLPWQVVQLPIFNTAYTSVFGGGGNPLTSINHWPFVREAERRVADADPLVSLVPAFDLGLKGRVHPPNKFLLADRLVQGILQQETGNMNMYNASGPDFVSATYSTSDVIATFKDVAEGLIVAIKQPFTITPIDRKPSTFNVDCFEVEFSSGWIPATANLAGPNSVKVTWAGQAGQTPTNVRYGWADFVVCNLYNERALPALPFTSVANPFA